MRKAKKTYVKGMEKKYEIKKGDKCGKEIKKGMKENKEVRYKTNSR
jgi:hypothetical protein